MRRFVFYLSVALLAFGIGSFVVFKFYLKAEEKYLIFQNDEVDKPLIISTKSQEVQEQNEESFTIAPKENLTCKDKTLRLFWNQLKEEVISTFIDDVNGDCTDFFRIEKFYDLNNDGKKEIFIRSQGTAFCGGVGNCQLYIFSRKANSYKSILHADMAQRLKVKKNKSYGYFDVEISSHGSSTTGGIGVYEFNGEKYEVKKCFDYSYVDKYNIEHKLDKPILTKRDCWKDEARRY